MSRRLPLAFALAFALVSCAVRVAAAQETEEIPPWERGDDDDSAEDEGVDERDDGPEPVKDEAPPAAGAGSGEGNADEPPASGGHPTAEERGDEDHGRPPPRGDSGDDELPPARERRVSDDEDDDTDRGSGSTASLSAESMDPEERYRTERMGVWRYRSLEEYPTALAALFRPRVRWSVRTASGRQMTAIWMARFLGDAETARLATAQQAGSIALGTGVTAIGVAILLGGTISHGLAAERQDDPRTRHGASGGGTGALAAGLTIGPVLIGTGTGITIGLVRRTREVARYYEREDAEDAVERYNERLLRKLGLDPGDVRGSRPAAAGVELAVAVGPTGIGAFLRW